MPLSIGGVVGALLLSKSAFSLSVTIGLLMLMGIVTKNTIMLVDFAVERVRAGASRKQAIIDACRKRARPIIMTTTAMIAGMLPASIGVGAGGELRAPMAIAVIGGLLASTLLSLLFIPAVYTITDDASQVVSSLFGRVVRPNLPVGSGAATKRGYNIIPSETRIDRVQIAAE
jgi:multidrug efflux pump subunit AcrB